MGTSGGSRISPRRGRQLPRGRQHMILPNFTKNCMKLKEFGPRGGAPPLDPSLGTTVINVFQVCSPSANPLHMIKNDIPLNKKHKKSILLYDKSGKWISMRKITLMAAKISSIDLMFLGFPNQVSQSATQSHGWQGTVCTRYTSLHRILSKWVFTQVHIHVTRVLILSIWTYFRFDSEQSEDWGMSKKQRFSLQGPRGLTRISGHREYWLLFTTRF